MKNEEEQRWNPVILRNWLPNVESWAVTTALPGGAFRVHALCLTREAAEAAHRLLSGKCERELAEAQMYRSVLELRSLLRTTLEGLLGPPLQIPGPRKGEAALRAIAARLASEINRFVREHPDDRLSPIDAYDLDVAFNRDTLRLSVLPAQRAPAWIHFAWQQWEALACLYPDADLQ